MPVYNKLIRDRILEVLEKEKLTYISKVLNEKEFGNALQAKFHEEIHEFEKAEIREDIIGELVDILELVHAAANLNRISIDELEAARLDKKEKRGGFEERLFLVEVED